MSHKSRANCSRRRFLGWAAAAASAVLAGALTSKGAPSRLAWWTLTTICKLADLTLWSKDPYTAKPNELWQIPIAMTIVGGRVVYQA